MGCPGDKDSADGQERREEEEEEEDERTQEERRGFDKKSVHFYLQQLSTPISSALFFWFLFSLFSFYSLLFLPLPVLVLSPYSFFPSSSPSMLSSSSSFVRLFKSLVSLSSLYSHLLFFALFSSSLTCPLFFKFSSPCSCFPPSFIAYSVLSLFPFSLYFVLVISYLLFSVPVPSLVVFLSSCLLLFFSSFFYFLFLLPLSFWSYCYCPLLLLVLSFIPRFCSRLLFFWS